MVRTMVQLTEEQARELRKRAKESDASVSELVRQAVDILIHTRTTDTEVRKRAREAVGFADSGSGDLVERHNEYFTEAGSR